MSRPAPLPRLRPMHAHAHALPLALALALVFPSGCSDDRVIVEGCDDGELDAGALCFAGARHAYEPGLDPYSVLAADYDGDNADDLLILGLIDAAFVGELRLGRGDAPGEHGLGAPVVSGLYGCSAYPAQGELGADPRTDVFVAGCGPQLLWFPGATDGAFDPAIEQLLSERPRTTSILDVSGDGTSDMIVLVGAENGDYAIDVALGVPGSSTLAPVFSNESGQSPDYQPYGMVVGDLDGDGFPDAVLIETAAADGLRVAYGGPGGTFSTTVTPNLPFAVQSVAVADLDDDGDDELVVAIPDAPILFRIETNAERVMAPIMIPKLFPYAPANVVTADLDGDGLPDLLAIDPTADEENAGVVSMLSNRGDSQFAGPVYVDFEEPVYQLAFGDLNDDGALDLVAGTFDSDSVRVQLANP